MWRSTKAVCSTNNVLCMWLVFHQHTQYSIYILSTDPALNVKLFMLSQPLYSDTEMCVWKSLHVCVWDRLLCPPPRGCAVLCSGSNDGFCASQSPSQQDTHIKGSFSGQPCARVSMCCFLRLCVCVCVCVCICAHLCVILRTSFSVVHADCASYWARVQPIKVHIGTLGLCLCCYLSFAPYSSFFHLSFRSLISPPCMTFLLSSDNFSALSLCLSAIGFYQRSLSFFLLQIEAATLQKTMVPLGNTLGSTHSNV